MDQSSLILPKDRNALVRLKWAIERLDDERLAMMLLRMLNLPRKARLSKAYLIAAVCRSERQYRKLRDFLFKVGCWRTETNRYEVEGPLVFRPYMFGSRFEVDLRKLRAWLPKGRRMFKKTEVYVSDTEKNTVVETDAAPQGQAPVSTVSKAKRTLDGPQGDYLAEVKRRLSRNFA